ncbi:MAG TPA: hypothetical protein VFI27_19230 [candidate division Zixibacteria bacterium]|nr:hypothetical protein [candidate division Zixibacteria bacterium]
MGGITGIGGAPGRFAASNEPVTPLPEIAQRAVGQTYVMDENPAGYGLLNHKS